jgi:Leucine-rich repeat (LRR) protein
LNNNDIKILPNNIGQLSSLEILYLDANFNATIVNENIADLINLKELYLSQNRLSKLPSSYTKLTNLKILDLSENSIIKSDLGKIKKSFPNCEVYE